MENTATGAEQAGRSNPDQSKIRRSRALINIPPLVFVSGFIMFWIFLIIFGNAIHIPVLKGTRHMPAFLELLGWVFLFGTVINFLVYPVLWLLLYVFKDALAARARYFAVVWTLSGSALWLLWPYIYWFMD